MGYCNRRYLKWLMTSRSRPTPEEGAAHPKRGSAQQPAPTKQLKYQDYVDEQRAGKLHGVFIDETGSPGLRDTPSNLHPDRKSWVAVIVPKAEIAEVWQEFPGAIA